MRKIRSTKTAQPAKNKRRLLIGAVLLILFSSPYSRPYPVSATSVAEPPYEQFVIDGNGKTIIPYFHYLRISYLGSGLYCLYAGYSGEIPTFYDVQGLEVKGFKLRPGECYIQRIMRDIEKPEDFEHPTDNLVVFYQVDGRQETYDFYGKKITSSSMQRILGHSFYELGSPPPTQILDSFTHEKGYSLSRWGNWSESCPSGQYLFTYRIKDFRKDDWLRNGEYERVSRGYIFSLFLKGYDLIGMRRAEVLQHLGPPQKKDSHTISYLQHREGLISQLSYLQIRFDSNDTVKDWRHVFDCDDPKASIKHYESPWESRNMTPGPDRYGHVGALVPKYPERETPPKATE